MQEKGRVEGLDIVKGIAMLLVICIHSTQRLHIADWLYVITQYGRFGCQAFLLASGFALSLSYEKKKHADKYTYRSYIKNKIITIGPGYDIAILLYFCINYILEVRLKVSSPFPTALSAVGIIENALLIHGLIPDYNNNIVRGGWYIGTTVILYILYPVLRRLISEMYHHRRIYARVLPWCLMFLSMGIQMLIVSITQDTSFVDVDTFLYFNFTNQIAPFVLGIVLYYYWSDRSYDFSSRQLPVAAIYVGICYLLMNSSFTYRYAVIPLLASFSFAHLFIWIDIVYQDKKIDRGELESRIIYYIKQMGANSYGIYLAHGFFAWGIPAFTLKFVAVFINVNETVLWFITFCIAIILSFFSGKQLNRVIRSISNLMM